MTGEFVAQQTSEIAISYSDYQKYGCPNCKTGKKKGFPLMSYKGCQVVCCSHCQVAYIVCNDGIEQSSIGVGAVYPEVVQHPLLGREKLEWAKMEIEK